MWIIAAVLGFAYIAFRIWHEIKTNPQEYKRFLLRRLVFLAILVALVALFA